MCGILGGLVGHRAPPQDFTKPFIEAVELVKHRGPDGSGFWRNGADPILFHPQATTTEIYEKVQPSFQEGTVFFGHRRLSIIDLSENGSEPLGVMSRGSSRKDLWIVFNGEVYNYVEIRKELEKQGITFRSTSDTEVVLRAYEVWGPRCFTHFNGMWAIAIWDDRRHELVLSRDRMGVKPLYYCILKNRLYFSSEIKQLLHLQKAQGFSTQWNVFRLYEFLSQGHEHHAEETFFEGIYNFKPAHFLVISPEQNFSPESVRGACQRYWDFPAEPTSAEEKNMSFHEMAQELRRLLTSAVELRLRSDVPVGSALSGGLDSSAIVSIIGEFRRRNPLVAQKTFTATFPGHAIDERHHAEQVIANAHVKGVFVEPNSEELMKIIPQMLFHHDGPFWSTSMYAQWAVFQAARAHSVPVMLDGQGADEIFAGYEGFLKSYLRAVLQRRGLLACSTEMVRFVVNHPHYYKGNWLKRRLSRPVNWLNCFTAKARKEILEKKIIWQQTGGDPYLLGIPHNRYKDPLRRALYESTTCYSLPALLAFEDRNSMAFSVESRTPFLDYRIVELAFQCPPTFHIRGGMRKALLREAMRGILPEAIRMRKDKLGFVTPEESWKKNAQWQQSLQQVPQSAQEIFQVRSLQRAAQGLQGWRALSTLRGMALYS